MKRYPLVLAATAAGLGTVLGFHPASSGISVSLQSKASNSQSVSGAPKNSSAPQKAPATTTPSTTAPAGNGTLQHSGTKSTTPASTVTTTSPSPSASGVQSATGRVENYGYGQLAVKVTISSNKIKAITLAQIQVAESYSQSIADQVIPLLKNEVVDTIFPSLGTGYFLLPR